MRTSDGVTHIHGDHLVSATNTTGPNTATQRYFPWGARRSTTELPTPYRFTGQREESKIGLYFYNARWYDPALGRFVQADTVVPDVPDVSLSALSVSFANPAFLEEVGRENRWRTSQDTSRLQPPLTRSDKPRGLGIVQWFHVSPVSSSRNEAGAGPSASLSPLPSTGPGDPQNLNRFTYVSNNPLTYIDPSGYWTFGVGLGGTIGLGKGLSGSVMFVMDDNFHLGIVVSAGGGAYAGGGASGGITLQRTNADTIYDLEGPVVQTGGSVSVFGANVGAEWVVQRREEQAIQGWNVNIGVGVEGKLATPFEMHGMLEVTRLLWSY
ncbi:MAG: hypothetical protein Kow00123_16440 [Anaerolineales bacterium]